MVVTWWIGAFYVVGKHKTLIPCMDRLLVITNSNDTEHFVSYKHTMENKNPASLTICTIQAKE